MKKHDEGYALVLVVVVMIVMSLVAASVLTFSLRNLQNQQKSIQRMEDKYAAQGLVEEYVQLSIKNQKFESPTITGLSATDFDTNQQSATITAQSGSATITCKAKLLQIENSTDYTVTYISYEITYQDVQEEVPE